MDIFFKLAKGHGMKPKQWSVLVLYCLLLISTIGTQEQINNAVNCFHLNVCINGTIGSMKEFIPIADLSFYTVYCFLLIDM